MSKLFVTGSLGFIGRNLVYKLKELGHEVYEHDIRYGSLTIPNALDVYYEKGIEHVFHLAARTFVPQSWNDPA
ncbi:MAG: NAD-dependent epimerase/dehydratase family protein, partial [Bacteroidia bacterium]|nr:NAD-dependent epimerase/dehydratase family protein [Bacteroidia bacterium]